VFVTHVHTTAAVLNLVLVLLVYITSTTSTRTSVPRYIRYVMYLSESTERYLILCIT
jgi:hypothetical protein